jgi:hypothetical protein
MSVQMNVGVSTMDEVTRGVNESMFDYMAEAAGR